MSETHPAQAHVHVGHGPNEGMAKLYMKVWTGLLVFTLMEYFYASFAPVSFFMLVIGLMIMAFIKASMVGWYFMHLKYEENWVYVMLVPVAVMVMIFIVALYPDIGSQKPTKEPWEDEETAAITAPLVPGGAQAYASLRAAPLG